MKNIVVIGGTTPGRFGHEFVSRTRALGNRVKVLTWHQPDSDSKDLAWADFSDHNACVQAFNELVVDLPRIDILLYNATGCNYADDASFFRSSRQRIDAQSYFKALGVQVIVPHALSLAALKKMGSNSAIVFMTTGLALDHNRSEWTNLAGYAGGKSWQTHLMLAFAYHNDKQAICTALAPFFNYEDPDQCTQAIDKAVDIITNLDQSHNGQILWCN